MAQWTPRRIIDTHIHILQPSLWHYHWLQPESPLNRDYGIAEIAGELSKSHVEGAVFIEATNKSEEIEWLIEINRGSPFKVGIIGWIAPDDADLEVFTNAVAYSNFKGVRINWLDAQLDKYKYVRLLDHIETSGLMVELLTRPQYLPVVEEIISGYPKINFVLDHLAGIELLQTPDIWKQQLDEISKLPNVIGKISGFSQLEYKQMRKVMRELTYFAFELFGSARLMFGSNAPFGLDRILYSQIIQVFAEAIEQLPHSAQMDISYQTATRIYQLEARTGLKQ